MFSTFPVEANYQNVYYAMDGILAVLSILVLFGLDVQVDKAENAGVVKVLRDIASPPAFFLFGAVFVHSINLGINQYLPLFAQADLGARRTEIEVIPFARCCVPWMPPQKRPFQSFVWPMHFCRSPEGRGPVAFEAFIINTP